jgi:DNA replication protein DnaC
MPFDEDIFSVMADGPLNTDTNPLTVAREIMEELRENPDQNEWHDLLTDDVWMEDAVRYPSLYVESNRILNKSAACAACEAEGGAYAGTERCSLHRFSVDVTASLKQGQLVSKTTPCPYVVAERQRSVQGMLLADLGIDEGKADMWCFSSMMAPLGMTERFREVRDRCRAYATDNDGKWMLLYSDNNGTGKTHLAIATGLEFLQHGIPARHMNCPDMFMAYKARLGDREDDPFAGMQAFTAMPSYSEFNGLLIIDDLGKEIKNDRFEEMLYVIVENRDRQNLPTFITTNKTIDELRFHYSGERGRAIISRIVGRVFYAPDANNFIDMSDFPDFREQHRKVAKP